MAQVNLMNLINGNRASPRAASAVPLGKTYDHSATLAQQRLENSRRVQKGDFRVDDGFGGESQVASLIKGLHLAGSVPYQAPIKKSEQETLLERVSDPRFAVTQGLRPDERSDVATCIKAVQIGGGTPLQAHLGIRKS